MSNVSEIDLSKSINLFQGDCLEVMKDIPDRSVDAIITDMPYGIDFSEWDVLHNNKNSALLGKSPAQEGKGLFKRRGKPLNGWSKEDANRGKEFQDFCTKFLDQCLRVLKPASPILVMTGRQMQHRFIVSAEDVGFVLKDTLTWNKTKAPFRAQAVGAVLERRGENPTEEDYHWRLGNLSPITEPIVYMFKPYKVGTTITDCYVKDGLGCFNSNILKTNLITIDSKVKDKLHETQKPVALMETLVELVTKEGHTVLDMFMGSSSTGVACVNTNRKFIGIELDKEYFEIAKKRIKEVQKNV